MTRITFGLYRAGVRDASVTLAGTAGQYMPPTPYAMATAAVTRYHREDAQRATAALERSIQRSQYWGAAGTPQGGWAKAIQDCFATYCRMAAPDPRPAFAVPFDRDVDYPPDAIGVHVDVVLLDPQGYVPRLVLWDTNDFTPDRALLYAAPAWLATEEELGSGRVSRVEVWHLRSGAERVIAASDAAAAQVDASRVIHRVASPP